MRLICEEESRETIYRVYECEYCGYTVNVQVPAVYENACPNCHK